jgi:hypothetical protein
MRLPASVVLAERGHHLTVELHSVIHPEEGVEGGARSVLLFSECRVPSRRADQVARGDLEHPDAALPFDAM